MGDLRDTRCPHCYKVHGLLEDCRDYVLAPEEPKTLVGRPWPYQRGYAAIGLWHPKDPANVGGAMRAAHCYGAQMLAVEGARNSSLRHATNTVAAWKHMPTFACDDLHVMVPFDCVPVAVDLVDGAVALPRYQHPARAFYVFGPEDGTLGRRVLDWCRDRVSVPTRECMNLAATVNVVLYDRLAKAERSTRKLDAFACMYGNDQDAGGL